MSLTSERGICEARNLTSSKSTVVDVSKVQCKTILLYGVHENLRENIAPILYREPIARVN
jgi:hypothetical protein